MSSSVTTGAILVSQSMATQEWLSEQKLFSSKLLYHRNNFSFENSAKWDFSLKSLFQMKRAKNMRFAALKAAYFQLVLLSSKSRTDKAAHIVSFAVS